MTPPDPTLRKDLKLIKRARITYSYYVHLKASCYNHWWLARLDNIPIFGRGRDFTCYGKSIGLGQLLVRLISSLGQQREEL
jgi:hypothetical protein